MKIVILCGGKGTRLAEETKVKPKPMVKLEINLFYLILLIFLTVKVLRI